MTTFRRGVRIGVDVGTVRVGVARSDPDGILSIPVATLNRAPDGSELEQLVDIINEFSAIEVLVGLPKHLAGGEGVSAKGARKYARRIALACPQVRLAMIDERLTSNQAHERLREAGMSTREHRPVIDQVAAQIIVEQALEWERSSGHPPGQTFQVTN